MNDLDSYPDFLKIALMQSFVNAHFSDNTPAFSVVELTTGTERLRRYSL